jgi:signal transduction histidine kinase
LYLALIVLSGIFISKLAVDPLENYIKHLQSLSKETLHELNLPISTIVTNTQMLKRNIQTQKDLKRIQRIDSACSMLKERYNELDYMIKMQSKQVIDEDVNLKELIESRSEFFKTIYQHFTFNLTLENINVKTDKIGLVKIIDNIIDNGVKYSKDVKVIDIKIKNRTLMITDYGIGMDEVELLKIFDKYYQSNDNMQGFGIGLNMVKRFCDNNNIKLNFISKPDVGTTVELTFKN